MKRQILIGVIFIIFALSVRVRTVVFVSYISERGYANSVYEVPGLAMPIPFDIWVFFKYNFQFDNLTIINYKRVKTEIRFNGIQELIEIYRKNH